MQDLPEKIQVEILDDNFWTNILIIVNIIVSIIVAWFINDRIERKAKEYEVKAHIEKLKAERLITFCTEAHSTFNKICLKNPNINPIDENDIRSLDSLILSKEIFFLEYKSKENIQNFRDYIVSVMDNPKNKDTRKEKSFFYLIKQILNKRS